MIRLRRYLVAGLLVWLPVGATILVFRLLLGVMDRLLFWLPVDYRPEALIGVSIPGLNEIVSGVLAFLVLAATGMLAANFLGKQIVSLYESVLARIPFVRTVYGAVKNFVEVLFSDTDSSFRRVLLIEYPRKGLYCLVFQTSENADEVQERTGETVISVFLPTTPNPTSGFILFVPRQDAVELDMSVEDALKMIVSLGVVVPRWHPVHPDRAEPLIDAPAPADSPAIRGESRATQRSGAFPERFEAIPDDVPRFRAAPGAMTPGESISAGLDVARSVPRRPADPPAASEAAEAVRPDRPDSEVAPSKTAP